MVRYYLAHPILDRKWVRKEERRLERTLHIELANPFYDGPERGDIKSIDAGKVMPYGIQLKPNEIVFGDLNEINKSNGLVAFVTPSVSVGTFMEIFYNAWVLKHPTYLIITYKRLQTHPWLRYCATEIFKSPSEFEAWYKRNYNGLQKSQR
jgi:hypothetical protein